MLKRSTVCVSARRRRRVVLAPGGLADYRLNLWQDADRHPRISRWAFGISCLLHVCILSACAFWPAEVPVAIEDAHTVTLAAARPPPPLPPILSTSTRKAAAEKPSTNTTFAADQQGLASPFWREVRTAVARRIQYPPAARREGIEGTAVLKLTVGADGQLVEAVPLESTADVFAEEALRAARRAAPFPAMTNHAAAVTAVLPVRFQLDSREDRSIP